MKDQVAFGSIAFTFFFVFTSVLLEVVFGLIIALLISPTYPGRSWVRAAVLIPWAIPTVVSAVMWKYMLNDQYGLVNFLIYGSDIESYQAWLAYPWSSRLALVLVDVWKTSSFAALLILAGLQAIPAQIFEAARVDGANSVKRFFWITLPLLRPAILVAILFRTMDAFRVFDLVYVMTQGAPGNKTNVLQFYGYQKMFPEQLFGYGSSISTLVFLIIAVIAYFSVRTVSTRVFDS